MPTVRDEKEVYRFDLNLASNMGFGVGFGNQSLQIFLKALIAFGNPFDNS